VGFARSSGRSLGETKRVLEVLINTMQNSLRCASIAGQPAIPVLKLAPMCVARGVPIGARYRLSIFSEHGRSTQAGERE
jgi:hypothetical protein